MAALQKLVQAPDRGRRYVRAPQGRDRFVARDARRPLRNDGAQFSFVQVAVTISSEAWIIGEAGLTDNLPNAAHDGIGEADQNDVAVPRGKAIDRISFWMAV